MWYGASPAKLYAGRLVSAERWIVVFLKVTILLGLDAHTVQRTGVKQDSDGTKPLMLAPYCMDGFPGGIRSQP